MYCPTVFGERIPILQRSPEAWAAGTWTWTTGLRSGWFRRCELGAKKCEVFGSYVFDADQIQISSYKFRSKSMDKSSSWNHCWGIVTQAKKQICPGGGFTFYIVFFYVHPYLGGWSNLTSIFFKWIQMAPVSNGVVPLDPSRTFPGLFGEASFTNFSEATIPKMPGRSRGNTGEGNTKCDEELEARLRLGYIYIFNYIPIHNIYITCIYV